MTKTPQVEALPGMTPLGFKESKKVPLAPLQAPKVYTKKNEKRIEQAYYAKCRNIQVSVLDIGKVFAKGYDLIGTGKAGTDEQLAQGIYDFVQTIRKN